MAPSRIVELSAIIARDTAVIEDFCTRYNVASPSFDESAAAALQVPAKELAVIEAKQNLIVATRELSRLVQGVHYARMEAGFMDAGVFQTVVRFRIAEYIPVGGEVSFEDLSQRCGVEVGNLRRILRFGMTGGLFCEPRAGYVGHSSWSRALAENKNVRAGSGFVSDEVFPSAAHLADALQKYPASEEPTQSGWGLANNANLPMFDYLHQYHPTRGANAAAAMDGWGRGVSAAPLVASYPWADVDTVVDIGGGHGPVSVAIARAHERPRFVVQDLGAVVAAGQSAVPPELSSRVTFMEHDLFADQPVKDADVYFFRSIFHDWPDKHCVRMLQALRTALKPGARIVINDACMPPPGTMPPGVERERRKWDLNMMMLFNGRDREEGDWAGLFHEADSRFKFIGSRLPDKCTEGVPQEFLLNIIEAVGEP